MSEFYAKLSSELQQEQDVIVDNNALPWLNYLFPQSKVLETREAKHEILFERDDVRNPTLLHIFDFFREP